MCDDCSIRKAESLPAFHKHRQMSRSAMVVLPVMSYALLTDLPALMCHPLSLSHLFRYCRQMSWPEHL